MDPVLDIFTSDAFSIANLRQVTANVTYVPQALGQMNLFTPQYLEGTDKVLIYEEDGVIRVIATTERGGPDIKALRDTGRFIGFQTKRLSEVDSVRASELLGIADEAQPRIVRTRKAADLLTKRLEKMKSNQAFTKEKHRFGALGGILYDADGTTVLYNYFTEFGLVAPTAITLNLSTWTEAETADQITNLIYRPMIKSLNQRATPQTRVGAIMDDAAWSKLIRNPAVRKIWELQQQGRAIAAAQNPLVQVMPWSEIEFGGVLWMNYRGTDDGTTIALAANEVRFFPIGARDVFDVYWAPGETMADVNEPGREEYTYIQPDVRNNMVSHVDFYLRSYPLYMCIYPKALMKGLAA